MKYKKIALTQGKFAIVDVEDFEELNKFKWCFDGLYASRSRPKEIIDGAVVNKHQVRMHREILQPKKEEQVDHKNGNGLDNRRANIRLCTHAQNKQNTQMYSNNSSGHKGVSYLKGPWRGKKWLVRLNVNKKVVFMAYFLTKEEAIAAYKAAAAKYHGEFAKW